MINFWFSTLSLDIIKMIYFYEIIYETQYSIKKYNL